MRILVSLLFVLCLCVTFDGCETYQPKSNATNSMAGNSQTVIAYVASTKSKKYHLPSCEWASKITDNNKIAFKGL